MPIRFKCPHCQKPLSVKDHLAGKKAACPVCKKPMTIPSPVAAAADLEDFAARSLADEPEPVAAAAKTDGAAAAALPTIDFNCPFCDAQLHLPGEQGGKQMPCPECKHILKVPKLIVERAKDWREIQPTGPSAAIVNQPKELEGAWGTGAQAKVSREALEDADAIVDEDEEPVGVGGWVKRGVLAALLIGAAFWGYTAWSRSRSESRQLASLAKALEWAPDDADKGKLPPLWAAEVHRGAGEFFIRAKNPELARKHLLSAMQMALAPKTPQETLEADALLIDIALTMTELGGSGDAVENKERVDWKDVMTDVNRFIDKIQNSDARLVATQEVGAKLRRLGQPDLVSAAETEVKGDGEAEPPKSKQRDSWSAAVAKASSADIAGAKPLVEEARKEWKNVRTQRPHALVVLQFARASSRVDPAGTKELLKTLPPVEKEIKPRANLECLLVHLEQSRTPAEFSLADEIGDKESSAFALAWGAIARQKTRLGQRSDVLATQTPDGRVAAFLHLGAALGDQDRK